MIPSQYDVEIAIKELGDTSAGIHEKLKGFGIKGIVGNSSRCPISNYLSQKFKGIGFSTGYKRTTWIGPLDLSEDEEEINKLFLPEHVLCFISEFDNGEYPDLMDEKAERNIMIIMLRTRFCNV